MPEVAERTPFQFPEGSGCPDLDTSGLDVELASLPEFCSFGKLVKTISFVPPDPEPDPPISTPNCPCPSSNSEYVSFTTSQDCCDWTLHLDYAAIETSVCRTTFGFCECEYDNDAGRYVCMDSICRMLPKGGATLVGGGGQCPHYTLVWKPFKFSAPQCEVTLEPEGGTSGTLYRLELKGCAEGDEALGDEKVDITYTLNVCVKCSGQQKECAAASFKGTFDNPVAASLEKPELAWYHTGGDEGYAIDGIDEEGEYHQVSWDGPTVTKIGLCYEDGSLGFKLKYLGPDSVFALNEDPCTGSVFSAAELSMNVNDCSDEEGEE